MRPRAAAAPPLDALVGALARAGATGDVESHETHVSLVAVAGDRALKVKKPVVLPFLDYGTLARRRAMCREEVRVNRRLARELYLGAVGLRPEAGGLVIDRDDEPGVVEVGVLMRRFRSDETLAARVAAGTARPEDARAVGALLARFHAGQAQPATAVVPALAALRAAVRTTLDDLEAPPAGAAHPAGVARLRGRLEAVLSARREQLLERGARGLVADGHGDLRAEHVVLTDPPQVVDALEFDPALRVADVAADLGFLVMDLEGAGAPDLGAALVAAYRAAGGDPGDDALLAAVACYRALVRAKVDVVRAGQGDDAAAERAEQRLALALRLGWRALGPVPLVVCGPPASGKSTLAAAVAAERGTAHLSSDRLRKARAGLDPGDRAPASAYRPARTLATYRELGESARAELDAGRGVVLDATLGAAAARDALRAGLGPHAEHLLHVECRVPAALADARAHARLLHAGEASDAGPDVAARLRRAWQPLDEVPAGRHLILRADRPPPELLRELWAWLDRSAVA